MDDQTSTESSTGSEDSESQTTSEDTSSSSDIYDLGWSRDTDTPDVVENTDRPHRFIIDTEESFDPWSQVVPISPSPPDTRPVTTGPRIRLLPNLYDPPSNDVDVMPSDSNTNQESEHNSEVSEPPAKVRKMSSPPLNSDDGDGETCPICLDSWGNSGDHRLVALKCGHLFGFKCVERWIRGKNSKERCCPTCKAKASLKDIRCIYAKRLVAVDMTELTALQKQVETVEMEKNQIQMELQATKLEHRSLGIQLELLQKSIRKNQMKPQQVNDWRFALEKNLEVWRDGGCRVLAFNCRTYEFYVSQKTNNLFPGYGVRSVNSIDYKLGSFIHLHPKAIRDIAYSQPMDLLLSAGLDGTARIVERGIPAAVVQCGMPLWSCTWDRVRTNQFYVGGVGGVVRQYDVRNTGTAMETFNSPGDMSPCVSLCSTEFGLLSCQLNSCWLWRPAYSDPQPFPVKGPFTSLSYDVETQRAVVSCRPRPGERARLAVYKMHRGDSCDVVYDLVQSMPGSTRSTLMSRAAFVKCPDAAWVASYSESDSLLFLYPLEGGRKMTLPAAEATLDVCAAQMNGDTVIAALSETRLRLYRSIATKY
ncbi:E3 ubiquitin-protein ligase RFWD3-like [Epargyreus clarus]|uniref:E3 ubiquitin-protein ligase RFWD3-like n=1 Tax=Epargyreus clarus TaxID=520877 RepID=UPI003C2D5F2B